jgi:hypothetical protein
MMQQGLAEVGVPVLNLEVDCVDPRAFQFTSSGGPPEHPPMAASQISADAVVDDGPAPWPPKT